MKTDTHRRTNNNREEEEEEELPTTRENQSSSLSPSSSSSSSSSSCLDFSSGKRNLVEGFVGAFEFLSRGNALLLPLTS